MLITTTDLCRESIRKTLVSYAGESPDAGTVAEAALTAWQEMAAKLQPLIGARGVDVLLRRALHLTKTTFPGLSINSSEVENAVLLENLKAELARRETPDAMEASFSLLATFTGLLATLIGESLTGKLLCTAPIPRSSANE